MASYGLIFTFVILCAAVTFYQSSGQGTNCGTGDECRDCTNKQILRFTRGTRRYAVPVCCKSCSRYFTARVNRINGVDYPTCTCNFDRINGTCWKGDQCNGCDPGFVGSINGLPVCCANCLKKGLRLSPGSCDCNI